MKTPDQSSFSLWDLDCPDRLVPVTAQILSECIGVIKAYTDELHDAKRYCDQTDCESIESKIKALASLWDRISEAIEDPSLMPKSKCPICCEPVAGELFQDPTGQYKEGICEYCWSRSI